MKYYIFLDDSGQLHKNYPLGDYFIYAGLLMKEKDFHGINKNYKNFVKGVKRQKGIKEELKTSNMDISTRRRFLKKLAKYSCEQIFVSVKVSSLNRLDFDNKKHVVRFKNYVVRRLIDQAITNKKISNQCELIDIYIDNQNVAHSALDSLEDHLFNYFNQDNFYYVHKKFDTTSFRSDFKVSFRDSETNYLIQAADLLANTEFNALQNEKSSIRKIYKKGYTCVRLP